MTDQPAAPRTVIKVVTDLMLSSKISGAADLCGFPVVTARNASAVSEKVKAVERPIIIVDLNLQGADPFSVIQEALKIEGASVMCFFSHVDVPLAKRALELGARQVYPRSKFFDSLESLLKGAP